MIEEILPQKIEEKSFELIKKELLERKISLPKETESVVLRAIHATADFDFALNLKFSADFLEKAARVFFENGVIVTDTNMAFAGISELACKKLGIQKYCFMADEDVALAAKNSQTTRATCSVDKTARLFAQKNVLFAVGNAPTALVRIRQLFDAGIFAPTLVIATPVGFVNVVAAKELILESELSSICALGRKGGSTVAAAIVNALLYDAKK